MKKVIVKLEFEGKDFGYMRIDKKGTFYGGGSESEAVEFELEKYSKLKEANYFKVSGTKGYLDFKATSSILFSDTPWLSVDSSSICAWKIIDNELHAILGGKDTTKAVSRSAHDSSTSALYANSPIDNNHCTVTLVDATKKSSNNEKEELKHALTV
ncbi:MULTISPECIES: hypothetical protein [Flavobacterium]|uniref:Uncharacterized protein n=1 Tax=Flavobacterium jumunjinense TaxID=998845 RepID=A0ABV5GTY5_9FLAO|nr:MULTISPECIES: hypothetical protein [Flavobacterium]